MNLARMMTDRFFIEDRNGLRSGPFKTKFGSGTIMVFQGDPLVAEGDRIVRPLPDGSELIYIVEGCAQSAGSRHVPPHLSIKLSEPAQGQEAITPAARTAWDGKCIAASLQSLAQAIEESDFSPEQKSEAGAMLRALATNPVVAAVLAGA